MKTNLDIKHETNNVISSTDQSLLNSTAIEANSKPHVFGQTRSKDCDWSVLPTTTTCTFLCLICIRTIVVRIEQSMSKMVVNVSSTDRLNLLTR